MQQIEDRDHVWDGIMRKMAIGGFEELGREGEKVAK